jgi:hypothetical protein
VLRAEGGAGVVALQDEVDDAADGVRAIDGGGAVHVDLDALDGAERNGVEVDEAVLDARRARHAATVDQNQRVARAAAAQIGGRHAQRAELGHWSLRARAGMRQGARERSLVIAPMVAWFCGMVRINSSTLVTPRALMSSAVNTWIFAVGSPFCMRLP